MFTIELPALRQRIDDLALLVEHFIRLFNPELGKNVRSIAPEAMRMLEQYEWPGNVRELQSAMKYALVRCVGQVLTVDCLPASCRGVLHRADESVSSPLDVENIREFVRGLISENHPDIYHKLHGEIDRILLPEILDHVGGNQAQASEMLGIARSTLRTKITDLGLTFEKRLKTDSGRDD